MALPALIAPLAAFALAGLVIAVIYGAVGRRRPGPVNRAFRIGQLVSSSALSLAHGTNDAQKTMGVIVLALVAHGDLSAQHVSVPTWVVLAAATAIALGTYAGGWPIIRTIGTRIIKMDPAQGFAAQSVGAFVILISSHYGYPLSSTQVISGGVTGAGAAKRLSAVRWGVASNIVLAWLLTLPVAGAFGALAWWLADVFGSGALGPCLILLGTTGAIAYAFRARRLVLAAARA
jgi:PiT family inorganic phosphate transporter